MGIYLYICCRTCKKYVHAGKLNRPDFENPELVKKFIEAHTFKHDIFVIHDAVGGGYGPITPEEKLYCEVMHWEEVTEVKT